MHDFGGLPVQLALTLKLASWRKWKSRTYHFVWIVRQHFAGRLRQRELQAQCSVALVEPHALVKGRLDAARRGEAQGATIGQNLLVSRHGHNLKRPGGSDDH